MANPVPLFTWLVFDDTQPTLDRGLDDNHAVECADGERAFEIGRKCDSNIAIVRAGLEMEREEVWAVTLETPMLRFALRW